ncbi:MAG: glycerol kinase GlpK [Bacteroidales bacterium]|nr:glycerol kinase GlpK [Bacteroidales bacterium]
MAKKYILALDQGTTSSRAILFDKNFDVIGIEQSETTQLFPKPGWVEQDATEIRETQIFVARKLLSRLNIESTDIITTGITNQRETTVIWDKKTGNPVYNAIVWQDKRTSELCEKIKNKEISNYIKEATGLIVDPYFSATKIKWLLENVPGLKQKAINNEILFGTIDTWLIWNLSKGANHITDYSNASRTMLYNINDKCWDKKILDYFDIPETILPQVKNSADKHGFISEGVLGKNKILLSGIAGDQQAALFGQTCFEQGSVKNTYGTGCFMLMNTGEKAVKSASGLITTIAWGLNGKIVYALEGSVFIAGAAIQWLRDKLRIIETAQETEKIAYSVKDTAGVYIVPAFAGLGAPYWNMNARGIICGLTGAADYRHIVRASLEAMAFQTKDVLNAMEKDAEISIKNLNVDGGASKNNFLLQFQADILNINATRPVLIESTALGTAFLAAIGANIYTMDELKAKRKVDKTFIPKMSVKERNFKYDGWTKAIKKSDL